MKTEYFGKLRCATGAGENFEFNEDKTYVKCTSCGREYSGGYNELLEYNQEVKDEIMDKMKDEAEKYIRESLQNALKGFKNIKLK